MSAAQLLWDCRCRLGEGALWNAAEQALYFVDIEGRTLFRCEATGAAQSRWTVLQMIGWVVPRQQGGLLAQSSRSTAALSAAPSSGGLFVVRDAA